jgi:hypothetical protein
MIHTTTLSGRDTAILRAVAAGRAELEWGAGPDLFLDGHHCSDQTAAHHLVRTGLIAAARRGLIGQRVAARLTAAGRKALLVPATSRVAAVIATALDQAAVSSDQGRHPHPRIGRSWR